MFKSLGSAVPRCWTCLVLRKLHHRPQPDQTLHLQAASHVCSFMQAEEAGCSCAATSPSWTFSCSTARISCAVASPGCSESTADSRMIRLTSNRPCRCETILACSDYCLTLLAQINCLHIMCALHSLHQFVSDLHAMVDTSISGHQLRAVKLQIKVTCSACPLAVMGGRSKFQVYLGLA